MKLEQDKIEELFRSELEDLKITPKVELENSILNQINFDKNQSSRRLKLFTYLLIILLAFFGGCLSVLFSKDNSTKPIQTSHSIKGKSEVALKAMKNYSPQENNELNDRVFKTNFDNTISKSSQINIEQGKSVKVTELTRNSSTSESEKENKAFGITLNSSSQDINSNDEKSVTYQLEKGLNSILTEQQSTPLFTNSFLKAPFNLSLVGAQETPITFTSIPPLHFPQKKHINSAPNQNLATVNDSNKTRYRHVFGIGSTFSFATQKESDYSTGDKNEMVTREPAKNFHLIYAYNFISNLKVQSGFEYERWSESWIKSYDTTMLIVKDTIIDGEPATIVYFDTLEISTNKTYYSSTFGIPLSIGYFFNLSDKFSISLTAGGLFSSNFVRKNTTVLNSDPVNLNEKQRSFSFSPKYRIGFNYRLGRIGINLNANYSSTRIGKIDLFERSIDRNNWGLGLGLYYCF